MVRNMTECGININPRRRVSTRCILDFGSSEDVADDDEDDDFGNVFICSNTSGVVFK